MIIRDLDIEEYHAHPAVSSSKLKDFRNRGALYYYCRHVERTVPQEVKPAFVEGQAFEDLLFLGQGVWEERYIIKPETYPTSKGEEKPWHRGATYCKEWEAEAATSGKTIVSQDMALRQQQMVAAVRENNKAMILLSEGEDQVSLRNTFSFGGQEVEIQSRPDWCRLGDGEPLTVDLKTTRDLSLWVDHWGAGVPRDVLSYGYHIQEHLVRKLCAAEGLTDVCHYFIVVEKQFPFRCVVATLEESFMILAHQQAETTLQDIAACYATGRWPRSVTETVDVRPSDFMLEDIEIPDFDSAEDIPW